MMHFWIPAIVTLNVIAIAIIAVVLYRQFDNRLREEIRNLKYKNFTNNKEERDMKTGRTLKSIIFTFAMIFGLASLAAAQGMMEPTMQDHLDKIANSYIGMQDALARDTVKNLRAKAGDITSACGTAIKLAEKDKEKNAGLIKALEAVKKSADAYKADPDKKTDLDIKAARDKFYKLSNAVTELVYKHFPEKDAAKYHLYYCPMAKGYWLQKEDETLRNPYYGNKMLKCGKKLDYDRDYDPSKTMGYENMTNEDHKMDDGHMMDGDHMMMGGDDEEHMMGDEHHGM